MSEFTDSAGSKSIDQREHNNDAASKRVVIRVQDPDTGDWGNVGAIANPDGTFSFKTGEPALAVRIDDSTTADTTYIGKADIGSDTDDAVWQIAKLATSSGLIKTWADGDASFNNVWDSRSSLNYS